MSNDNFLRGIGRLAGDLSRDDHPIITDESAEDITHDILIVVAEFLQSWLDAGSERDNTHEELFDPIFNHVRSWKE